MPQPLSKRCPGAHVTLASFVLDQKPTLTRLVGNIIAESAYIDHEWSLLMARILGTDATAAIAIFDVLKGFMKREALQAAAKTALTKAQYRIFLAVVQTAATAQSDRHKIAHGIWGTCPELPNSLLIADPTFLRWQEIERSRFHSGVISRLNKPHVLADLLQGREPEPAIPIPSLYGVDKNHVLVYSTEELIDSYSGLLQASAALFYFKFYLKPERRNALTTKMPKMPRGLSRGLRSLDTSAGALRQLSRIRRFRRALADLDASERKKNNKETRSLPG